MIGQFSSGLSAISKLKYLQTVKFRGSKSRNKVSVGEPAEGSLERTLNGEILTEFNNLPARRICKT
jgi:hypothetical protein